MYQALGKASAGIALNLTRFFPAVPRSFLVSEVLSLPPHHPPFPVSGLCLPSSRLINPREPYSCGLPLIPHIASGCSLLPPHSWSSATCKSTINLPLRLPRPCCLLEEDGNQICGRTRWRVHRGVGPLLGVSWHSPSGGLHAGSNGGSPLRSVGTSGHRISRPSGASGHGLTAAHCKLSSWLMDAQRQRSPSHTQPTCALWTEGDRITAAQGW